MKDKMIVLNIIGCLLKKPDLLFEEEYNLKITDFPEKFHQIVFAAINNMVHSGVRNITSIEIDNFLLQYDKQYKTFTDNEGIDFLEKSKKLANIRNFDFYYKRLKKISLLNSLDSDGFDIREIIDEDELDVNIKERMQSNFDEMSIEEIINTYDAKIIKLREEYTNNIDIKVIQAGEGLLNLKEEYKITPEMGMGGGSNLLNTITRGLRLKKFYLRSSPSGVGKTRLAVGDICRLSVCKYYDWNTHVWIETNVSEPSLFITTELEKEEIQTLILANVSGVNEEKILDGKYSEEEEEVVNKAIEIIALAPFWIEEQPTFSIQDIENAIKRNKIENKIRYVFFDYIFMSIKMLMDITSKTNGVKLREDNILYMFSDKMKELCNKLNVHINSSSQLNGDWENKKNANQNLLRGAKALADKLDIGSIVLLPTETDLQAIRPIIQSIGGFMPEPNLVYHIYKVRRGKLNNIKLWVYFDYGTCRTTDLFVTDNDYNLITVESTTIEKILELTEDKNTDSDDNDVDCFRF